MSVNKEQNLFQMWDLSEPTVNKILLQKTVTRPAWNETYQRIYSLCVIEPWSVGESLFKMIEICLKNRISRIYRDLEKKSNSADFLKAFNKAWKQFSKACEDLNELFKPVNNHAKIYASEWKSGQREEIKHLGLNLWKNAFYEKKLMNKIVELILEGFKDIRRGFLSDKKQNIMIEVLESFKYLDKIIPSKQLVYDEAVTLLLDGLKNSYTPFLVEFSKEIDTFVEYLDKAISFWKNEEKLCSLLFDTGSVEKLRASFADNFIEQKVDGMFSECQQCVEEQRFRDFASIHAKIEQFYLQPDTRLIPVFSRFFKKMVFEQLSREKNEQEALKEMCKMYTKYRKELVEKDLRDHPLFATALEEALKDLENQNKSDPNETAKRLVNFCVSVLLSKESEEELDVKLDFTRVLFQNLKSKDVFENYYLLHLSKRLLTGTSRTIELEENMLSTFDGVWSFEHKSKIQIMIKDFKASKNVTNQVASLIPDGGVDSTFMALRTSIWPVKLNEETCKLPQEIGNFAQAYEQNYKAACESHKLTWHHVLSRGTVRINFLDRPYDASMNTFQMAILLLFQNADTVCVKEMQDSVCIPYGTLVFQLDCLLESGLVTCDTEVVLASSLISLNLNYSNELTEFKIPQNVKGQKSPTDAGDRVEKIVHLDRKYFLEAAIVRVVKSCPQVNHDDLIEKVISAALLILIDLISELSKIGASHSESLVSHRNSDREQDY
ncbi:Hypothetical predicted protein [Cloeon dipterum]|uniref:Cullin family profile domain-containing protein n=1 Tax=Cloeon dipterum TaxID=197152 RepID=A0A8S1DAC3_9INSE|nr:Hypothetical predicted protein [Cloeon dipterum]